jgi:two-component system, NarL family, nitrate/nitrite response regulator NarL
MTKKNINVLVASGDGALVTRFTKILGFYNTVAGAGTLTGVMESVASGKYHIVILDPEMSGRSALEAADKLASVSSDTHLIMVDTPLLPEDDQVALFKLGVHGFCQRDITSELLLKAVNAVVSGELWMPRALITRIIDDLTRDGTQETRERVASGDSVTSCLTPRELEVARMVHKGGNNKTIARKLDISERTVKAHLSSIFRKLNIENRLHLAIFFHNVE